ncbi:aminopeptidase [Geosporobacter ferrireducens]|uniref:Peptidase M29 n=1 Tax=Geosporobacter ferrireducens TaxID=1424294 RepID=A0A1D8GKE6_9FIRM|nr:aminopeptidase [Geosporobacter ferrireducens]AOT71378.1 peptidase M29 [Geosporobacter ferrireducens]MTI57681.1 aminopeptidase [Geosporobacter ferrireducens]
MADLRIKKLADLLVNYSFQLKKGEKFLIEASDLALPLVKEIYREALHVGANPELHVTLPGFKEMLLKTGNREQLEYISPIDTAILTNYDALLTIWGDHNTRELTGVDPLNIACHRAVRKDLKMKFLKRAAKGEVKWCGTQFPTHSDAQEAGMSLEEYEDFVYGAGLLNEDNPTKKWKIISEQQEKICNYLNTKKVVRIVSVDTDITFCVEGRKWINCDGKENFPDGEVFTTPVRDSVNGTIRFTYPAIYSSREVEDVRLTFENGKVIKASAEKGEDFLLSVLDTDEGARYVGEIAIGTNYGIQRFTKNILFDEKIGGTIHLAVGSGMEETGGSNESSIHWDMICDMRDHGQIYADDELIYEKGKFIINF